MQIKHTILVQKKIQIKKIITTGRELCRHYIFGNLKSKIIKRDDVKGWRKNEDYALRITPLIYLGASKVTLFNDKLDLSFSMDHWRFYLAKF